MKPLFDLEGHRGARGLRPENTLPAFEAALDLRVTTLETDIHLTKDRVPVLFHDEVVSDRLARVASGANVPPPATRPLVSTLTLAQLRGYVVDQNPDPRRFPEQKNDISRVAQAFSLNQGLPLYAIPTLQDLLDFASAYAGELGRAAGKTPEQRERARSVRFNLELKRVPFHPEYIGDEFDGKEAGELERAVIAFIRKAEVLDRVVVQSFDHRALVAARRLAPKLTTAMLIAGTAPVSAASLAREAGATIYSPDHAFLDARLVRDTQATGLRVIPWTVNDTADMERLLDWGVDGMITDYPQRLIPLLQARQRAF
jgi:glycerophosphoryl diester phosphodiesterase